MTDNEGMFGHLGEAGHDLLNAAEDTGSGLLHTAETVGNTFAGMGQDVEAFGDALIGDRAGADAHLDADAADLKQAHADWDQAGTDFSNAGHDLFGGATASAPSAENSPAPADDPGGYDGSGGSGYDPGYDGSEQS